MDALSLKKKWDSKFGESHPQALKSVASSESVIECPPNHEFLNADIPVNNSVINNEDNGDCMDPSLHETVPVAGNLNPELFVGNIRIRPANSMFHDTIAEAFHQSSRKELNYIPPTLQNGEIIVRPSPTVVETENKKKSTKKPVEIYIQKSRSMAEVEKRDEVDQNKKNELAEGLSFTNIDQSFSNQGMASDNRKTGESSNGKDIILYNQFELLQQGSLESSGSEDTSNKAVKTYTTTGRRELWQGILQLSRNITDEPWIVMCDFNAVIDDSEVSGYAADTRVSMADFLECITEAELTHLPFTGAHFTWHNCSDGGRSLWKRLDRMLVNEAWLVKWPQSKYFSANPRTSDHSPLILQGQDSRLESAIFRFENYMTKMPGFQHLIEDHWTHNVQGTAMYKLTRKLKSLKPLLRGCNDGGYHAETESKIGLAQRRQLFGVTRRQSQLNMDHLQPFAKHLISEDEAEQLISPIQRQEIKDALFDINEDSAPGPDGFSSCFFKATWTIIGEDVCQAVMEFFNHGRLLKQLNATLITLIPKVQMPMKVGDFRPISCCNVVYKIITKIMVKRMHLVLEKLIDSCQNAFVPGRSISDNILLAQELLSGYNQKKLPPRCTVKVDLQKAYDMVDWDYLLAVLRLFKFPNRFIMWIEQCITTASFSISLNGSIHGFFSSSRGLRQGDPISPYLFVLVIESLHLIIKSKVTTDTTFQYRWRCKELGIVNLCFADDLLLFCKADPQSVTVLHRILQEFKDLAGLQANAQKSQVLLSKTTDPMKQQILNILGFPQGTFPVRYLGVPLITSKLSLEDCTPLLLKIDARISGWNQLQLTYAGRTQLIKSILSSIHQHWCSVFILPKGVLKAIEAKLRNFLWRGGTATGGYKVAWEQVCEPISHGGLGIRNIQTMNNALMSKHLWQILIQKHDSIWVSWITKHRLKHGTVWAVKETEGSWIWKKLLKLRARLLHGIQYHVGDGAEFKLWLDPWHPDGALLNKHPHGPFITGLPMDSNLSTVWRRRMEMAFGISYGYQ
ncbi:UNVERIFIED_CONTAM: hypothetical protein Sradi_6930300 [Sesamum radiatum]|uniref:Reverse transcriptase domain-containing protein n=1 Tax=Sesamum radiatum TaxID=300843 RepID=A0AAW2JHZ3_SESRA